MRATDDLNPLDILQRRGVPSLCAHRAVCRGIFGTQAALEGARSKLHEQSKCFSRNSPMSIVLYCLLVEMPPPTLRS